MMEVMAGKEKDEEEDSGKDAKSIPLPPTSLPFTRTKKKNVPARDRNGSLF
jgi:hypothetical protein